MFFKFNILDIPIKNFFSKKSLLEGLGALLIYLHAKSQNCNCSGSIITKNKFMTHWILSFILFNFLLRVSKKCIEGFFFTVYAENRIIHCTFACCDRTLMCALPKWILQQIRTNPNCESKVHPFNSFGFLYHHGNSATSLNQ